MVSVISRVEGVAHSNHRQEKHPLHSPLPSSLLSLSVGTDILLLKHF